MKPVISVIIPCFNEEECLPTLLEELEKVINILDSKYSTEVLVIDDHSNDRTSEILTANEEKYSWLNYIRVLKNQGSHVANYVGLKFCKGKWAFVIGADMQARPEILVDFIKKAEEGHKLILGQRVGRNDPLYKKIPSAIFNQMMARFVIKGFPLEGGDVFLIDRVLIDAVIDCKEKNINIFVLLLSLCSDFVTVPYHRYHRFAGESKWTNSKLIKLAYDSIISVSLLPIKVMFWIGAASFGFSILLSFYIIVKRLQGAITVEGWTSLLIAVSIFGGLIMISISLLGEYIWRSFDQTRSRPMFLVEKKKLKASSNKTKISNPSSEQSLYF